MEAILQLRRGNSSEIELGSITLLESELFFAVDSGDLYIGTDGSGGWRILNSSGSNYYTDDFSFDSSTGEITITGPGVSVTGSLDGRYLLTSSFESFTESYQSASFSFDARLDLLETTFSLSVDSRLDALENATSSISGNYVDFPTFESVTESLSQSIDRKLDTASFDEFSSSFLITSASIDSRLDILESGSGSYLVNNQAGVVLTGSFTGSFVGDGSGLTGISDTNWFPEQIQFNSSSGYITISGSGMGQISTPISLDSRYLTTLNYQADSASFATQITTISSGGYIDINFNSAQGELEFSSSDSVLIVDLDGRYTEYAIYYPDSASFDYRIKNLNWLSQSGVPLGTISSSQQITDFGFISQSQDGVILTGSFSGTFAGANVENYYPYAMGFQDSDISGSGGELTIYMSGSSDITVDLDGRYLRIADYISGTTPTVPAGTVSSSQQIIDYGIFLTESSTTDITALNQFTESYFTNDSTSFDGRLDSLEDWSSSLTLTDANFYVTGANFDDTTGDLSIFVSGASDVSTNLDGRYQLSGSYLTELPAGVLSSSAQIASDISGAFTEPSSGFDARLDALESLGDNNFYPTDLSFNDTTGELTLSGSGMGILSESLDGRYQLSGSYLTELPNGIVSTSAQISAFGFISESVGSDITALNQFTESYITQDSFSFDLRLDDLETWSESLTISSNNYYVTGTNFNDTTGELSIFVSGFGVVSTSLDGRYLTELPTGIVSTSTQISDFGFISESVATDISALNQFTESYITQDSFSFDGRLDSLEDWSSSLTIASNNYYATGANFNDTTGELSIFVSGADDFSTSLDGRYQLSGSYLTELPTGIVSTSAQISAFGFISESVGSDITALNQFTESYFTNDSTSFDGRLDNLETWSESLTISSNNYYVTGTNFNDTTGDLNIFVSGFGDISTSLDGRYLNIDSYSLDSASFDERLDLLSGSIIVVTGSTLLTASYENTTSKTVNHNFGTKNVIVSVYDQNDYFVIPDAILVQDDNNVVVTFSGPSTGYIVVAKAGHIVSGNLDIDLTPLNQFTESADIRITDLENWSSSLTIATSNYYTTGAFFDDTTGELSIFVSGFGDISTSLDGRYQLSGSYLTELPAGIVSTSTQISDFGFISESVATDITALNQFTESYLTQDSVSFDGRLDSLEDWSTSLDLTDDNFYVTGTNFNDTTGELSIFVSGFGDISTSLDGRYQLSGSYLTELPAGIVSTSTQISDFGFISESTDITALNQFTESYFINDSTSFDGRLDSLEDWSSSLTFASENFYVTGANFDDTTGELNIFVSGFGDISTSLDGRYLTELPAGIVSTSTQISNFGFISESIATDISALNQFTESYFTNDSTSFDGRLDSLEIWSESLTIASDNYFVTGTNFDANTGDLNIFVSGFGNVSTSLDGRYLTDLPAGLVSSSEQISDITGSSLVTASYSIPNDIIFEKGDGSQFTLTLNSIQAVAAENTFIYVKNVSGVTIPKGTPLFITGSGTEGNIAGVVPADAGNPSLMPAGVIAAEELGAVDLGANEDEGVGWVNGFISGVDTSIFASGDTIYVAVGGGYTNEKPTGSALIQKLGNVEKSGANGSGVINGPGYYNDLPNVTEGYTWVGNSDGVAVPFSTASFVENFYPDSMSFDSVSGFLYVSGPGVDLSTSLDDRYVLIDSYSVDSASFDERLISGSLLSVVSTCEMGELPPATDVYAIYDATSMQIGDAESASVALKEWFGEYTASHPDHTGQLYILSTGDENYLSYPYKLLNNTFSLGTFTGLHELPNDWGVGFQYPSNSVLLAFVDETRTDYHGISVDLTGQPTAIYNTDYSNYLTFSSSVDYFSGVLYPIPRDTTGETAALILQGLAAMKARTLTIEEISASLGDNVTQIDVTVLTGSNPYTNPLENVGWQGVFDKSSPAADVFNSTTFGTELNTLLLGEATEDTISIVQSYADNTLTLRGLKSNTLNFTLDETNCISIEVDGTVSTSFDARLDILEAATESYVTGAFFDSGSGELTLYLTGANDVVVDLDGRYSTTDTTYQLIGGSGGPNSSEIILRDSNNNDTSILVEGDDFIKVGDSITTMSLSLDTGSLVLSSQTGSFIQNGDDNVSLTGSFSGSFFGTFDLLASGETLVTASFTNTITASVTHNFDTVNVLVQAYDTGGYFILPDEIQIKTPDSLELHFDIPASGYVVVGKAGHIVSGSSEVDITQLNQFTASYYIDSASFDSRIDNITAAETLATASFTNTTSGSVSHNFGTKNVLVSVYDSANLNFIPDRIELLDDNNVEVEWVGNKTGHIVVSKAGHIVNGALPDGVSYNASIRTLSVNDVQIGRGNSNEETNTILGKLVAQTNTNNLYTTAIGYQSQQNNGAGDFNTSVGACSLISHSGTPIGHNTAIGYKSMSGSADITGGCNTAVGSLSLADVSGSVCFNVAVGYNSGPATSPIEGTVSVGYEARARGNNSIAIGRNAFINAGVSNSILIGANTTVSGSNVVKLGNASNDTYQYYGTSWVNPSDERDKTCIQPISDTLGLNFVMKLNPVEYRYDYRENYQTVCNFDYGQKDGTLASERIGYGLVAQEVEATLKEMNQRFDALRYDTSSDQYSIGYTELIPSLIKAIQEQQTEINNLKDELQRLRNK